MLGFERHAGNCHRGLIFDNVEIVVYVSYKRTKEKQGEGSLALVFGPNMS